ncbi:25S rRNA (uridine-N(3))-methyltransferase [Colletotrichum spaethianum]|uniref:25S rRNA (Uridine-N(3))-methyltransferase n=1 Tax=Colletotrichum spaethianum TaxID=700344 RepID=A0AA37LC68_9PEZI|nr:25S rRNA (uridine-N(3))-methyltransferase [Colletotrichum spaethianum]GKT43874.1 25S rRNA (uridine-N(3))-methyltransferase [Colletotrichum spaethianum]
MAKKRKLGNISHRSHFVDSGKKKNGPGGPAQNNKKKNSQSAHAAESDAKKKKQQQQYHQNQEPVIPFAPEDTILLIGEGDLSFAASLAAHHGCRNVTATVLEKNERELLEKYPHAAENIALINGAAPSKPAAPGSKPAKDDGEGADEDDDAQEAEDDPAADEEELDEDDDEKYKPPVANNNKILYNVDARTMKPFTRKSAPNHRGFHMAAPSKQGIFKRILFNFPHVGGKSTDRNRQVRYNQELLVAFFNSAIPSLAPGGTIVVTLFEGDPYTLWNVKDLGRHAGLQSLQSFRFHSKAYPGYKHARTLGVVREKKTGEASGAAWKGEERPARSYVFMRKDEAPEEVPGKKKRKRGGDESSSEEESEVEDLDD